MLSGVLLSADIYFLSHPVESPRGCVTLHPSHAANFPFHTTTSVLQYLLTKRIDYLLFVFHYSQVTTKCCREISCVKGSEEWGILRLAITTVMKCNAFVIPIQ